MSFYKVDYHPALQGHHALYASKNISKGEILFDVSTLPYTETNNMYALTIKNGIYLNTENTDVMYINHSCDPTLAFDTKMMLFTAKRNISAGEMLTFDYTLTETSISSPFDCLCGVTTCKGYVGIKKLK